MSENFQDVLPSVIASLVKGMTDATDAQMADLAPMLQPFIERGPDEFNVAVLWPWSQLLEAGIRLAFAGVSDDRLAQLEFLFAHGDFVTHHLEKQIKHMEGWGCSFDKVLWILNHYAMWLASGGPLPTLPEERKFFHPKTMTVTFWFEFCDHLQHLYFGQPQHYLEDLSLLLVAHEHQALS